MTRHHFVTLLFLVALTSSCSKHDSPARTDSPGRTEAASRLCQHIGFNRLKIVVDTNQAEIVWSDGRMLELATNFPGPVKGLLARPDHYLDIRSFVAKLQAGNSTEWRNASIAPSRSDRYSTVRSTDGSVSATVASLYLEYLQERYPTASVRIKGDSEPILFVVGGEVRASVMPIKF